MIDGAPDGGDSRIAWTPALNLSVVVESSPRYGSCIGLSATSFCAGKGALHARLVAAGREINRRRRRRRALHQHAVGRQGSAGFAEPAKLATARLAP